MEINKEIRIACELAKNENDNSIDDDKLNNVLDWRNRIASANIVALDDDEVIVFGSDKKGNHKGGVAQFALSNGWAKLGQSEGVPENTEQIHSYAIPTTNLYEGDEIASEANPNQKWNYKELEEFQKSIHDEDEPQQAIEKFTKYAAEHSEKKFLVTAVGTGLAGFSEKEMSEMFKPAAALKNVYLPMAFWLEIFKEVYHYGKTPSHMVPCKSKPANEFQDELNLQLALYCQWLRTKLKEKETSKGTETNIKTRKVIMAVERNCNAILRAVDLMYRGLPSQAYDEIEKCLEASKKNNDYNTILEKIGKKCQEIDPQSYDKVKECLEALKKGTDNSYCDFDIFDPKEQKTKVSEYKGTFYRLREEKDNWAKRDVDVRGMFHLPYNLRHLASTQRYSVPGYPSMYMGEHVFSCWEERGRPNLSNCLISRIESQKPFKVLDLTIPKPKTWDTIDIDKPYQALLFPFIIASSFKAYSNTASFKPEYIIPQLLFQYVKNYAYNQNRNKANKDVDVYGIKYTSVHFPGYEESQFDRSQYDNYVVPVISTKNLYCRHLCELFHITAPFCIDYSDISTEPTTSPTDNAGKEGNLDGNPKAPISIFDKIENLLKGLDIYKLESNGTMPKDEKKP